MSNKTYSPEIHDLNEREVGILELLFRMVDLQTDYKTAETIYHAITIYNKRGGDFDLEIASKLQAYIKGKYDKPVKPEIKRKRGSHFLEPRNKNKRKNRF